MGYWYGDGQMVVMLLWTILAIVTAASALWLFLEAAGTALDDSESPADKSRGAGPTHPPRLASQPG